MPIRLAILTAGPENASYGDRWRAAFARYAAALAGAGIEAVAHPWIETAPTGVDAQTPLLAWGYHFRPDQWAARLRAAGPPFVNAADTLEWNTRKTYLLELADAGVPVVPTMAADQVSDALMADAFARFGGDALVVKPQISAASHLTALFRRGEAAPAMPGPVLVQPYLNAVTGEGELSLFYFGGRLSHAVSKVATGGDFRVQPQFGGRFSTLDPGEEARAVAEATLAAAPPGLTYARIDLLRDGEGRLRLMELEAIEPDLHLDYAPDRGAAFAAAMRDAIEAVRG